MHIRVLDVESRGHERSQLRFVDFLSVVGVSLPEVSPLHRTDTTFVALLQRIASGQEADVPNVAMHCRKNMEE